MCFFFFSFSVMLILEPETLVMAVLVPVSVSLSFLGCAISVLRLGQGMFWKKGKTDFFCAP